MTETHEHTKNRCNDLVELLFPGGGTISFFLLLIAVLVLLLFVLILFLFFALAGRHVYRVRVAPATQRNIDRVVRHFRNHV